MERFRFRPLLVLIALALLTAACSMFREGEDAPVAAALHGDDSQLAGLVQSITDAAPSASGMAGGSESSPASSAESTIPDRSVLFALHLASYRTESTAEAGWRIISAEVPNQLEDLHPRVETVDLGPDRGVYLRLKAGPLDNRAEADERCAALVGAGYYCQAIDFEGREIAG